MKKIIALTIGMLTAIGAAHGADLGRSTKDTFETKPAIATVATSTVPQFGGFFVGGSVNWDRLDVKHAGSADWSECPQYVQCALSRYFSGGEVHDLEGIAGRLPGMDDDAISGGIRAGYLFQVGRLYGGPVLMADFGNVEATMSHTFDNGETGDDREIYGNSKLSVGSDWRAAAVLKGGLAVTDWLGVYALGGVGFVDLGVSGSIGGVEGERVNVMNYDDTVTALVYGFGVDLRVTDNIKLFGEWNRFDLDSFGGSKTVDCFTFTHDGDADLDVIRVGATYSFN